MPPKIDRTDYQGRAIDEIANPDEPVFVIRAQDCCSGPTVRVWALLAKKAGASPDIVESALRHADLMDAWPIKKVPDLPKPVQIDRTEINLDDKGGPE